MVKRIQEYVRYTIEELDRYTKTPGSCVTKINKKLHITIGAFCLGDFKNALQKTITRLKVGHYDPNLEGIILDLKNIKVLSPVAALRADDPNLHLNINADCYVFRPVAGAVLTGVVKHIGARQLGVIIYRVFSVNIRLKFVIQYDELQMNQEVQFRIRTFDLQSLLPYIEGELQTNAEESTPFSSIIKPECDSGIENNTGELDEGRTTLKKEISSSWEEDTPESKTKKKGKDLKRKRKSSETSTKSVKIKKELNLSN